MANPTMIPLSNRDPESQATAAKLPDDGLAHLVSGYPKLAGRMGRKPETAIFRRFNELNAKILLYMQAELCKLEKELREAETQDKKGSGTRSTYSVNYERLASSKKDGDTTQLDLVEQIKKKLKEYNDALIQAYTVFQFKAPDNFDLTDLQDSLDCQVDDREQRGTKERTEKQKKYRLYLQGDDDDTWGTSQFPKKCCSDLVGLRPRIKQDKFSRWVAEKGVNLLKYDLGRWFKCQCCFRPKKDCSQRGYYDTDVLMWTSWATSMFASMLPIASIAILLHFKDKGVQVGIIAAFNVVLSACLMFLADAKRTECFAVIAAFTAVQVVFLGMDERDECTCYVSG